jgi:hypothetical protein
MANRVFNFIPPMAPTRSSRVLTCLSQHETGTIVSQVVDTDDKPVRLHQPEAGLYCRQALTPSTPTGEPEGNGSRSAVKSVRLVEALQLRTHCGDCHTKSLGDLLVCEVPSS